MIFSLYSTTTSLVLKGITMNTKNSFLIESLIGLGSMLLIVVALGFYMLNEQSRIVEAQSHVLSIQLDEAMTLYA